MVFFPVKPRHKKPNKLKQRFFSFESKHLLLVFVLLLLLFVGNFLSGFFLGHNLPFFGGAKTTMSSANLLVTGVPLGEEAYVERGSPLDRRFINPSIAPLEEKVIFHGPRDKKNIAITFDAEMTDGMKQYFLSGHPSYDKRIIDILNTTHTKATLFLTGLWTQLYSKEAYAFGQNPLFEIASHSYEDTSYDGYCYGLRQIPDNQDLSEIELTQRILLDITGVQAKYFRFPGGCYGPKDLNIVENQAHLTIVHWDVVGEDGFNESAQSIVENVVNNVQNGSIIVLHMNGAPTAPKTADALPEIIRQLKAKGFTFVTVSELLGQ